MIRFSGSSNASSRVGIASAGRALEGELPLPLGFAMPLQDQGQMLGCDPRSSAQDQGVLDRIPEFSNVAGPVVGSQCVEGVVGESCDVLTEFRRKPRRKCSASNSISTPRSRSGGTVRAMAPIV